MQVTSRCLWVIGFASWFVLPIGYAQNHVLSLDGRGSYVTIQNTPQFQGGENVVKTIEAWFVPKRIPFAIVSKAHDAFEKDWSILVDESGQIDFWSEVEGQDYHPPENHHLPRVKLLLNQWYHVAVVINRPKHLLQLFLNGELVKQDPNLPDSSAETAAPVEIGAYSYLSSLYQWRFATGYIDEVRIWNIARTETEIRETMFTSLNGDEQGLVGYWQFEEDGEPVLDTTPHEHHGQIVGNATQVEMEFPAPGKPVYPLSTPSIEGQLLMSDGKTPYADVPVQLIQNGEVVQKTLSRQNGSYQFAKLEPGMYQVRCYTSDGYVYYRQSVEANSGVSLRVVRGIPLKKIDFCFPPFKQGMWKRDDLFGDWTWVRAIHQDNDGTLLFGTEPGGVFRYDGRNLTPLTTRGGAPVNDRIRVIYQEPNGVLWFGTSRGGVIRYDGETSKRFTTEHGLAHNSVWAIYREPGGIMWFGSGDRSGSRGLSRYDGAEFVIFTTEDGLPNNLVRAIYRDKGGTLWFGTWGGGVCRYDGKTFEPFTTKDGAVDKYVSVIYGTPDGIIWFGTRRGLFRYDGVRLEHFTRKDGLAANWVRAIHRDPDGIIWFGTWGGGVCRYDGKGFVNFGDEDGLKQKRILDIHRGADGTLWVATYNGDVYRYDEHTFTNFTTKDGLPHHRITAIEPESNGTIWLGTPRGTVRYDGEKFTTLTTRDGLADNRVIAIDRAADGAMWFGTPRGGVSRYDGNGFVNFTKTNGLGSNSVSAICATPNGAVWLGERGGISRYNGKQFKRLAIGEGLRHNIVWTIYRDSDDAIWLGTYRGVWRYDGGQFVNFTDAGGLTHQSVMAIYRDMNRGLWFGTQGNGVFRYDGQRWVNFTTTDGLAYDRVTAICQTPDGIIYFGTDKRGVSLYDGSAWSSLDTTDGLAGNAVSEMVSGGGSIWIGTNGGLTRYRRSQTRTSVHIASVKTDQRYRDLSTIPVITARNPVTIEYNAVDFKTQPEKRQYRVRISKSNERIRQWENSTKKTTYNWTPDKPGAYTFEVQAIDRDLNYSETASLLLNVVLPWYLNGWITFPAAGGVFALLISAISLGWLYNAKHRETQHFKTEMEEARKIQTSLLPQTQPMIPGFEIHGFSEPVSIGGDFYDYIPSENNEHLLIVVGDAIGHGLPAAMNAQSTYRLLKQIVTPQNLTKPDEILSQLNRILYNPTQGTLLSVSMYLAAIDLKRRKLRVSRAGDCRAYLIRAGRVSDLSEVKGNDLGASVTSQYAVKRYDLVPDDLIVVCSDGFIDAAGADPQAPLDLLGGMDAASAVAAIESIQRSRVLLNGNSTDERADDITVIGVKVREVQANSFPPDQADATCINLTIPAEFGYERTAIAAVARIAQSIGLAQERVEDLEIAVGEACINAFEHAYAGEAEREVAVSIIVSDFALTVRVQDFGRGGMTFDKTREKDPRSRGWGLHLIEKYVDRVEIESPSGAGTQVCMTVYLPNTISE